MRLVLEQAGVVVATRCERDAAERRCGFTGIGTFEDGRPVVLSSEILNRQDADARGSVMTLGVGVEHAVETALAHEVQADAMGDRGKVVVGAEASSGMALRLTKFIMYQSSRAVPASELVERCDRPLDRVRRAGFASLLRGQRQQLDHFWDRADVRIEADDEPERVQQAIR